MVFLFKIEEAGEADKIHVQFYIDQKAYITTMYTCYASVMPATTNPL